MHAFVREEGCQSRESFHLCMNSNHSAGGGRWGGFTQREAERTLMLLDAR